MARGALLSLFPPRGNKIIPIPAPQYFNFPRSCLVVIALSPSPPRSNSVPAQFTTRLATVTQAK